MHAHADRLRKRRERHDSDRRASSRLLRLLGERHPWARAYMNDRGRETRRRSTRAAANVDEELAVGVEDGADGVHIDVAGGKDDFPFVVRCRSAVRDRGDGGEGKG